MIRSRARRTQLAALFAMALGAVAIFVLPGLASANDENGDHIPDRWEKHHHLSLQVNQAGRDQDHDHLRNRAEFLAGDNPRDADTNNDGVVDGEENAGTIASFDASTGKLVIDLFGGEAISGLVTEGTEIRCEGAEDHHRGEDRGDGAVHARRSHGDEAEPGDDRGGNGNEAGNDNGGHGEEPGDDNGGGNSGSGSSNSGSGSSNSGPGSSNSGRGGRDDEGVRANCTTADLTVGAVVQEAGLEIDHGSATFDEVELAHTAA